MNDSVADFMVVKCTTSEEIWKHSLLFEFTLK